MRMIPSLVVRAQDERSLVPTKYTSSKPLAGLWYQRARSDDRHHGGVAACVEVLRGATQSAPSKPRNSNPPAFLAAARWASIEFGAGCAPAGAAPKTAMTASAKMTR